MARNTDTLLSDARSPRAWCTAIEHRGMRPATPASLRQVGVMPRYGAAGLAGSPDFNTLLGRMR